MILPMKKVCLMVQEKSKNEALIKLREAGVVHIENKPLPENVSKAVERKIKLESAIGILDEIKAPKKKKPVAPVSGTRTGGHSGVRRGRRSTDIFGNEDQEPFSLDAVRGSSRPYLPDLIININKEKKNLQDRSVYITREISRIFPWGNFSPESIKEMESLGFPVYLYELTNDVFESISDDTRYILFEKTKNIVRIIVFDKELPGIIPFILPEKSMSAFSCEIDEIKLEIEELNVKLSNLVFRIPILKDELAVTECEIEFDNTAFVMESVEEIPPEMGLLYLTGYVPKEDMSQLSKVAAENHWAISSDDPAEEDEKVPTKLKNNKLVNLLNPVTDFLGIVPGYREVDISGWFLLFFCIFFAMIFGDAAYGILLTLTALVGIIITGRKKVPQMLRLLLLLGIFNTTWGVMTCSWFGVEIEKVPQALQNISFSYFSSAKLDQAIVDQNLQIFCFSLALLHLTIAHIKGMFIKIKSLSVFSEIGSIGMLWGMYNLVLSLVVSNDVRSIPLLPISLYLLGGGFFLNFIFGYYEGSILQSIFSSFKNFISVFLGVANVFSDIMSYIRLWAVGLAGAAIASTINTLAGPMLGNFLIFAGILLLVFGHGLNLVLNVLSVVVHGVRLNTLEFSGHLGLNWSGTAYQPFAEKKID
jgi:V/A-type H+-transporting ATPase subunit I